MTIELFRVKYKDRVVGVIPNLLENQVDFAKFLRVEQDSAVTRNGIAILLASYQSTPTDFSQNVLARIPEGDSILVETVQGRNGLFRALAEGSATADQKREAVELLDQGRIRCAEKVFDIEGIGKWHPQLYAIDAMNAAFSAFGFQVMSEQWYDKVPLKTEGWTVEDFEKAGVRFIPGSFARKGAYIGKGTTLMPGSIANTGSYIAGEGVMIDGGARVATGAQIGKRVKFGAGSGIEGILEPRGRLPSIVEDDAKIGANCEVYGIVEEGAVLASGVIMASGKRIIDLRTGEPIQPRYMKVGKEVYEIPFIPAGRVAIPGTYERKAGNKTFGVGCILLLEKDASETSLAELPKNPALYL